VSNHKYIVRPVPSRSMKIQGALRMKRPINQILTDIEREKAKLSKMPLGSELTLQQSMVVDRLINEYYRALNQGGKTA